MLTIAEEMSPEERASELLIGLSASSADEVALYFEHLAHAIGMELAEKMVVMAVGESSTKKSDYSTVPQVVNHCLCIVNRKQALEAVKKVLAPKQVSLKSDSQGNTGTDEQQMPSLDF